jgi:hypothetical protein
VAAAAHAHPRRRLAALVTLMLPLARFAGAAPPWVESLPYDPGRYIGVGRSDKQSHPGDYREAAQAAALAQISREISVRLTAENLSTQTEDGAGRSESYVQKITGVSENELSGYSLDGVYETEKEFWVCYSLDKGKYAQAREERDRLLASRRGAESESLEEELRARRLQAAVDRFSQSPFPALSERIRSVARDAQLRIAGSPWTFDFTAPDSGRKSGARILLADGRTGEEWRGPIRITLSDGVSACPVGTDEDGRPDLPRAFFGCGLRPGRWRVTWTIPGGAEIRAQAYAGFARRDIALSVRAGNGSVETRALREVEDELSRFDWPCFNVVTGRPSLPSLEVFVSEAAVDSLEGMYFVSIRGSVRLPGGAAAAVAGKAGHPDKARARLRAARDFARQAGALWGSLYVTQPRSAPTGRFPPGP